MILLANQTIDAVDSQRKGLWHSGIGTIICEGTFDGATVTLEAQIDEGEWVACGEDSVFITAGMATLELGYGFTLRGSVSGAGAGTDVSLKIVRMR